MHILVTNDDGVQSPGILALSQALATLGKVTIFAPNHNWSAAGHNKTMHKPLRVDHVHLADGLLALTTNGTPSDCVAMAVLGLVEQPVDLVVSGINAGANLGQDITYSGTVAGAIEATIANLPAIAVSLDSYDADADFGPAAEVARLIAALVLERGLPLGVFLNVNVPRAPLGRLRGVRLTRLGRRVYRDELDRRSDPRGRPYYWIAGRLESCEQDDDTDIWAVENCFVSVTPVHMDMTAYTILHSHDDWATKLTEALEQHELHA
ncbi:MAG: 5'/3'-nucleotidase SurE [Anaerolineae bacterium]